MKKFSKTIFPVTFFVVTIYLLLFGGIPGFRDGAHFYAPLFQYLHDELAAGRLPLWNPYENIGQPLAANPTTAFFYPGTLIALSVSLIFSIDPFTAYTGYVAAHLLLALLTSYRLARCWRCSREASTLAAVCYALSGNVLFQWNNVPFLVGAAWLPEALRQADRIIHQGGIHPAVSFGVVLALMTLGGDPQATYHSLICATIILAGEGIANQLREKRKKRKRSERGNSEANSISPPFRIPLFPFFLSLTIAFLLAAVQILPAWELGKLSDRSLESHRNVVFLFSVPPWRFVEFLFPNAGGWQFPENARWFNAIPFDNEIWVSSFYMGILPILLALFTVVFCFRRKNNRVFAALFILLLFAPGSLGRWFFVYQLFNTLPFYDTFRYPAKLLVVVTLMLAMLAGTGFDQLRYDKKFRRCLKIALRFYWIPVIAAFLISLLRLNIFPAVPACPVFGPFNIETAWSGLLFTAICVSIIIIVIEWVMKKEKAVKQFSLFPFQFSILFIPLVLFDLFTANTWMLATVPQIPDPDCGISQTRIYRFPVWSPSKFQEVSSKQRLIETVNWDCASLFPRYSLLSSRRINVIDFRGTLMLKDYYVVANRLRSEQVYGEPGIFEQHLAQLGVQYIIAPSDTKLDAEFISGSSLADDDFSLWKIRSPLERNYDAISDPNRLSFNVSLQEPKTFVLPEQYYPGWRAFLDGATEIPIHQAEKIFRRVDLPAGQHQVTMIYDPPLFKTGAILSLFGIILSLTLFCINNKINLNFFSGREIKTPETTPCVPNY